MKKHEINCTHCHNALKIDQSGYLEVVNQICDQQLENEPESLLNLVHESAKNEIWKSTDEKLFDKIRRIRN